MLWLVTLPFQLLLAIVGAVLLVPLALVALPFALILAPLALVLWVPFLLLKWGLRLVLALLLVPLLAIGGIVAVAVFEAAAAALLVPLLPIALLLLFVAWLLFGRRGAIAPAQ
jgi:hypothetical protein